LTRPKINEIINTITNKKRRNKMAVNTALYKVGDTYTSQKSKQTGVIKEIVPQANGNVRVRLDVEGKTRWTTWTPKKS
jgi:hypothetical protein